jgi:hypothetical protein
VADLDKLEKLNRLRESGALTAEEFEHEKALLLSGKAGFSKPLIIASAIAVAIIVPTGFYSFRQTTSDTRSPIVPASSAPKGLDNAPAAAAPPTQVARPNTAKVDPPVPDSAAPDPTNADYYNDAKRNMMRHYRDQPAGIRQMLGDWAGANELCRGSSDEATINKWCPIRDAIDAKLLRLGMCYGRPTDQSAAESDWHTCDARDGKQ